MDNLEINIALWKALIEIIFLISIGYIFRRIKFFQRETTEALTKVLLYLCLPALIFYSFVDHFRLETFSTCSFFIGISFLLIILGFFTGWIFFKIFFLAPEIKREFVSLNTFQNSGYLPLALITYIFTGTEKELAYLYIFSYLIGFNLVMLSFGFYYIKKNSYFSFKSLFSVPFAVSIIAMLCALLGISTYIPSVVLNPLHKLGEATIPLSMVLLGMLFSESSVVPRKYFKEIIALIFTKLIFLPLIIILFLKFINIAPLIKFMFFLEAAMPSATTLTIIASYKRADVEFVSQGIIATHIILIFTLPLLFYMFSKI